MNKTFSPIFIVVAVIIYSCGQNSGKAKSATGITVNLPSSWIIIENRGDSVFFLKAFSAASSATCDIHLYKLKEKITAFEYAVNTRYTLLQALYPEIMSSVYETKIGKNDAAGFSWVHGDNDAEVMVFSVKDNFVLSVDFQKMIIEKDRSAMDDLMKAIQF